MVTAIGATDLFFEALGKVGGHGGSEVALSASVVGIGNLLIIPTLALAAILVVDQPAAMDGKCSREGLFSRAEYVSVLLMAAVPFTTPAILSVLLLDFFPFSAVMIIPLPFWMTCR